MTDDRSGARARETLAPPGPVDQVNPSYYFLPSGVEVKDVNGHLPYFLGAAVKYILRAGQKGPAELDIRKAMKCLELEWERLHKGSVTCTCFENHPRVKQGGEFIGHYVCTSCGKPDK